ncbi:AAA family ATPase [Acidobacteria bacterium AH-259-D05]|nr:AAA family ATPase [Acidobacteria bacterium AH-259-D05]
MSLSTSIHDIKTLVLSFHPLIVIETVEENRVFLLLQSTAMQLGMSLFEWSITRGLVRAPGVNSMYGTSDPLILLSTLEEMATQSIFLLKDFAQFTTDHTVARKLREVTQKFSKKRSTIVLTGKTVHLPGEIEHNVVRYYLKLPGREELRRVMDAVLRSLSGPGRTEIQLDPAGLEELVSALTGMTLNQARQTIAFAALKDGRLSPEAVKDILERKAQVIRESGLLEYFPMEDNRFQLGGFKTLKDWLERAKTGFSPEARKLNLPAPRGILIVGVQGCGKSLAAKVIAREWKLPLLKLDAARLFDKYIGESEKNLHEAISLAESMSPVVLWIDEIEKAMSTGGGEADGGVTRRLFGTFLTWLQEKRQEVFVVATANDLSLLPPELLRKGRFDEIFFVDLPDAGERATIFEIHLELRKQDPKNFDLPRLVEATDGFSGAEIEQAVIASLYRALHLKQTLDSDLLLKEISETIPLSVSRREDIQRLRDMARERFVPVS